MGYGDLSEPGMVVTAVNQTRDYNSNRSNLTAGFPHKDTYWRNEGKAENAPPPSYAQSKPQVNNKCLNPFKHLWPWSCYHITSSLLYISTLPPSLLYLDFQIHHCLSYRVHSSTNTIYHICHWPQISCVKWILGCFSHQTGNKPNWPIIHIYSKMSPSTRMWSVSFCFSIMVKHNLTLIMHVISNC